MKQYQIRTLALALAAGLTAPAWAHGDPSTHFHASHGIGTLAGAVFVGALAGAGVLLLARAWVAWRRRAGAAA